MRGDIVSEEYLKQHGGGSAVKAIWIKICCQGWKWSRGSDDNASAGPRDDDNNDDDNGVDDDDDDLEDDADDNYDHGVNEKKLRWL